eukprot:c20099_g1_i7.p1 GENE.c20099_g1_i7~~c20099_g1_i7.p1  ORF type:complete len:666 (+),score=119.30 c20099_g1_i7:1197-3194(+)
MESIMLRALVSCQVPQILQGFQSASAAANQRQQESKVVASMIWFHAKVTHSPSPSGGPNGAGLRRVSDQFPDKIWHLVCRSCIRRGLVPLDQINSLPDFESESPVEDWLYNVAPTLRAPDLVSGLMAQAASLRREPQSEIERAILASLASSADIENALLNLLFHHPNCTEQILYLASTLTPDGSAMKDFRSQPWGFGVAIRLASFYARQQIRTLGNLVQCLPSILNSVISLSEYFAFTAVEGHDRLAGHKAFSQAMEACQAIWESSTVSSARNNVLDPVNSCAPRGFVVWWLRAWTHQLMPPTLPPTDPAVQTILALISAPSASQALQDAGRRILPGILFAALPASLDELVRRVVTTVDSRVTSNIAALLLMYPYCSVVLHDWLVSQPYSIDLLIPSSQTQRKVEFADVIPLLKLVKQHDKRGPYLMLSTYPRHKFSDLTRLHNSLHDSLGKGFNFRLFGLLRALTDHRGVGEFFGREMLEVLHTDHSTRQGTKDPRALLSLSPINEPELCALLHDVLPRVVPQLKSLEQAHAAANIVISFILFRVRSSESSSDRFIDDFFRSELTIVLEETNFVSTMSAVLHPAHSRPPPLPPISIQLGFAIALLYSAYSVDLGLPHLRSQFAFALAACGLESQAFSLFDLRNPAHHKDLRALLSFSSALRGRV